MSFLPYRSRPIIRRAHVVTDTDEIVAGREPSTSNIKIDGEWVLFNHYEPVFAGDYIIQLTDTDTYHCTREVFRERNFIDVGEDDGINTN